MRLCAACAGAAGTHVCSARYLQPPPYVPCVSARHVLCPSLAFPTSFCHLCLRKVSCALPQHVISSSLPLASMCAVYKIPSRTHTACLLGSILAAPRTCHACLPATYYVLLLPFPRASAICVCAKSHARCPSTSFVLLFPSLPYAPYTTFPHALTLSPLLNVGRGPAPWPDKQLCVAVSSSCRCFKHSCLRHTWRPPQTSSLA